MSVAGQLVGAAVGALPPRVIRSMARQYAAGATVGDAMREVRALATAGVAATVAVVGETATTADYVDQQLTELQSVLAAVERSRGEGLDVRLGVKPSALGVLVSPELAASSLDTVAREAGARGCIVEVDMEHLAEVDVTLGLVRHLRAAHPHVHAVVQAYLYRTAADVTALVVDRIPARVVKGTYKEGPADAFQLRESIRENYLAVVEEFLRAGVPVGIATHDEYVIAKALRLIRDLGVPRDAYEFQMIMGIQLPLRRALVESGHPVRVSVTFGADMHRWSVRRLRENPEIARHALAGFAGRIRHRDRGGRRVAGSGARVH